MGKQYRNMSEAISSVSVNPLPGFGVGKKTVNKLMFWMFLFSLLFVGLMVPKLSIILLLCLPIIMVRPKVIYLKENLILFMFLITYFTIAVIFYYPKGPLRAIINVIVIQSSYLLGVYTNWRELPYWPNNGLYAIIAFSMGLFLFAAYSFQFTAAHYPHLIYGRILINVWNLEELHALQFCIYTAPFISLIFPGIVALSRYRLREIYYFKDIIGVMMLLVLISIGLVGLVLNTILQNRTAYAILALSFLVIFMYLLFRQTLSANLKMIGFIIFLSIIAYFSLMFFFDFNLLGHILERRFEKGVETPRYTLWIHGLYNIFESPFGGGKMHSALQGISEWYHNLWLDVVRDSGLIPLLFLLIFQIMHLRSVLSIFKWNENIFLKISIIAIITYILSIYQSEPIIDPSVIAFGFTVFCLGVIKNLAYNMPLDKRISS